MLYIITEDAVAGYDFFERIAKLLFGKNAKVYTSFSFSGFPKKLEELYNKDIIHKDDYLFLCVDNVPFYDRSNNYADIMNKIQGYKGLFEGKGVKVVFSNFVSFEWLMLTFKYLVDYTTNSNVNIDREKDELCKMAKDIALGKGINMTKLKAYKNIRKGTDEKALKSLLAKVTVHGKFNWFKLGDNEIGACWITDCKDRDIDMWSKKFCDGCYVNNHYTCKSKNTYRFRLLKLIKYSKVKKVLYPFRHLMYNDIQNILYGNVSEN